MEKVRILEVKQSVFANNDAQAEKLREELKQKGIYLLNLMSSPGSGKTTTLTRLIELLKEDLKIGVMEADIDSDVDAVTIAATGAKVALFDMNEEKGTALAEELGGIFCKVDVTDDASVAAAFVPQIFIW